MLIGGIKGGERQSTGARMLQLACHLSSKGSSYENQSPQLLVDTEASTDLPMGHSDMDVTPCENYELTNQKKERRNLYFICRTYNVE